MFLSKLNTYSVLTKLFFRVFLAHNILSAKLKNGFANNQLAKLSRIVNIPVIASGGAGKIQDFIDVFKIGNSDAALAASVFHFGEITITELKKELIND